MSKFIPEAQKKLSEIVARYRLEPKLKDIYLEGEMDKTIYELFFDNQKVFDVKSYDISSIDFSELYQKIPSLSSNNRLKVITLGNLLLEKFDPIRLKVRCIIDKDFKDLLNEVITNDFILITDFSSIEGYLMDKIVMDKFLKLGFKNLIMDSKSTLDVVLKICLEFFLIRCTRVSTGTTAVELIEIDKGCSCQKSGNIIFDLSE